MKDKRGPTPFVRISDGWRGPTPLLCALVILAACGVPPRGDGLDVGRTYEHVAALTAHGPRVGGTREAVWAAAYVEAQLVALGMSVERMRLGRVQLPAIEVLGRSFRTARIAQSDDDNLVVWLGPREGKALLFIAHYDSVHDSPGAIDNAASVALLVELARVLAAAPPPFPVILAFTAEEESGLVGAEVLAARIGAQVDFAIALDLIGGSGELVLNGASTLIGANEMRWIASAAERAGVIVRGPLAHRVISRWWPQAERSDHGPFTRAGLRAVHFYHRGHDGEWIDRAYHSPRDVITRVDPAAVDEAGRLLRALVVRPPPPRGGDGLWLPLARNVIVPRWPLVVLEAALIALAIGGLVSARTARERGGLGLLAAFVAFALAAAATHAIEHALAPRAGAWLHDPLRGVLATAAVLAGTLGLITVALRRACPWIGALRYLVLATLVPLALGVALFAAGAAELAWMFLVPAAALAHAPRLGPLRLAAVASSLLPAVLVLAPDRLREAAWNGFFPAHTPLGPVLAVFLASACAGVAWLLRRRAHPGPLGALVLPVGCLLAIALGALVLATTTSPCTATDFNQFHLACELDLGVP